MSKRSIAVPVDTKASAAPPDPDTRMADADADADADDADAKSSPQAASSNEEESKTYQMLVKEIFLQQWSQDDDKDLEAYLTLIGNAEEYPDALCDAAVAAFQGKRDMISQQAKISKRTVSDLAKASLKFVKHQPERFIIVNEMDLSFFLGSLCTDVLNEYYKRIEEKDRLQTVSIDPARLGELFLREKGLGSYANAAKACINENPSQTLEIIRELMNLQDTKSNGIGCFAAILASSGTGKTQLAATASMDDLVTSGATVLYVNVSPGSSQRFYGPHDPLGRKLLASFKWLKETMGPIYSASANNIREWHQKEEDNMVCGFMHLLLFNEVPNDSNNQTNWQALRSKTETKEQPFLFFIDEVLSVH